MHPNFPFQLNLEEITVFTESYPEFQQMQEIVKHIKWHQLARLYEVLNQLFGEMAKPQSEQEWETLTALLADILRFEKLDYKYLDSLDNLPNISAEQPFPDEQLKNRLLHHGFDLQTYPIFFSLRHEFFLGKCFEHPATLSYKIFGDNTTESSSFYLTQFDYLPPKHLNLAKKTLSQSLTKPQSHRDNATRILVLQPSEIFTFLIAYKNEFLKTRQIPDIQNPLSYELTEQEQKECDFYCRTDLFNAINQPDQNVALAFIQSEPSHKKSRLFPHANSIFSELLEQNKGPLAKKLFDAETDDKIKKDWIQNDLQMIINCLHPVLDSKFVRRLLRPFTANPHIKDFELFIHQAIQMSHFAFLTIVLEEYKSLPANAMNVLISGINLSIKNEFYNAIYVLLYHLCLIINNEKNDAAHIAALQKVQFTNCQSSTLQANLNTLVFWFICSPSTRIFKTICDLRPVLASCLQSINYYVSFNNAPIAENALLYQLAQQSSNSTVTELKTSSARLSNLIARFQSIQFLAPDDSQFISVLFYLKTNLSKFPLSFFQSAYSRLKESLQSAQQDFEQFIYQNTKPWQFKYRLVTLQQFPDLAIDHKKILNALVELGETIHCIILCETLIANQSMTRLEAEEIIAKTSAIEQKTKAGQNRNDKVFEKELGFTIAEQSTLTMSLLDTNLIETGSIREHEQFALDLIAQDHIQIRFNHATTKLESISKKEELAPTEDLLAEKEIQRSATPALLQGNVYLSISAGKANITHFLRKNYDVVQLNLRAAIEGHYIKPEEIWTSMHYSALATNRTYHPFIFLSPCKQFGTIYRAQHTNYRSNVFTGLKEHHFYHVQIQPTYRLLDYSVVTIEHDMDIVQGDPTEFVAKKLVWFIRHLQSPSLPQHYGHHLETLYQTDRNTYQVEIESLINSLFTPGNYETKVSQRIAFSDKTRESDKKYFIQFIENPHAIVSNHKLNFEQLKNVLEQGSKQEFFQAYQNALVNTYNNHQLVLEAIQTISAERVSWLLELGIDVHEYSNYYLIAARNRCLFAYHYLPDDFENARTILRTFLLYGTRSIDQRSSHIAALVNGAHTPSSFSMLCRAAVMMRDEELLQILQETCFIDTCSNFFFLENNRTVLEETDPDFELINSIDTMPPSELADFIDKLPSYIKQLNEQTQIQHSQNIAFLIMKNCFMTDNVNALKQLFHSEIRFSSRVDDLIFKAIWDKKPHFVECLFQVRSKSLSPFDCDPFLFIFMYEQGLLQDSRIQGLFMSGEIRFPYIEHLYVLMMSDFELAKFYINRIQKPETKHAVYPRCSPTLAINLLRSYIKLTEEQLKAINPYCLASISVALWCIHETKIDSASFFIDSNPIFLNCLVQNTLSIQRTTQQLHALVNACFSVRWTETLWRFIPDSLIAAEFLILIAERCSPEQFEFIHPQLKKIASKSIFETAYQLRTEKQSASTLYRSTIHFLISNYVAKNNATIVVKLLAMQERCDPTLDIQCWLNDFKEPQTNWLTSETYIRALAIWHLNENKISQLFQAQLQLPILGQILDYLAELTQCAFVTDELIKNTSFYQFACIKNNFLIKRLMQFNQNQSLLSIAHSYWLDPFSRNVKDHKLMLALYKNQRMANHLVTSKIGEQENTLVILRRSNGNFILIRNSLHPLFHQYNNAKAQSYITTTYSGYSRFKNGKTNILVISRSAANNYIEHINEGKASWIFKGKYPEAEKLPEMRVVINKKQASNKELDELRQLATLLNSLNQGDALDETQEQIARLNLSNLKFTAIVTPEIKQLFSAIFAKNSDLFINLYQRLAPNYSMSRLSQEVIVDFPYAIESLTKHIERYRTSIPKEQTYSTREKITNLFEMYFSKKRLTLVGCAVLANNEPALAFLMTIQDHHLMHGLDRHQNAFLLALAFNRMHLAKLLLAGVTQDLLRGYLIAVLLKFVEPDLYSGFPVLKTEKTVKGLCDLYLTIWNLEQVDDLTQATEAVTRLNTTFLDGTKGQVLQALIELQNIILTHLKLKHQHGVDFHLFLKSDRNYSFSPYPVEPTFREVAEQCTTEDTQNKPKLVLSKTALDWDCVDEPRFTETVCYEEDWVVQLEHKRGVDESDVDNRSRRRRGSAEFFQYEQAASSSNFIPSVTRNGPST